MVLKLRLCKLFVLALIAASVSIARAEDKIPPPAHELTLRFGKTMTLTPATETELYAKTLELFKTSNFNSFNADPGKFANTRTQFQPWTIPEIQKNYRTAVAGNYLLLSFTKPQKIKTVGAELTVQEIVIGLNRPDYADRVFSIDAEGRVVAHGKYSGLLCVKLFEFVKKIAAASPRE